MGTANVTVWQYKGTLTQLLGTGLLNAFGSQQSGTISDLNGTLSQSDDNLSTFQLTGGSVAPLDYIGSGTMSLASLSVLGVPLISLSPVPVTAFQSAGKIWLMLPQGFPSLLGLNLTSLTASFSIDANKTYSLSGFIPCFVEGTRLLNDEGEICVEDVRCGDALLDHLGRRHFVLWHGETRVQPMADWHDDPRHPVRIPANAFGPGMPRRALYVSQQHRILLNVADRDCFAKAKFLVPHCATIDRSRASVTYHHILTARHATLMTENTPTESFLPGPVALNGLDRASLAALRAALDGHRPELAYPELSRRDVERAFRHHHAAFA